MPDSSTLSHRSCVMVLLAALVAAQSAVFFSGRTLLPLALSVTTQVGVPFGYSGPLSHGSSAIDPAGSLNVSYLFDVYSLASFKEWTLPFWNSYQGLGQPHLANGLSAVLYPLNLLFLLVPHTWWDVVYLLNWLFAAFFVTEYLRLIGVGREGMLVGGVAVLGSGFFQYYLAMREVVAVAAWFPLLLYALERTARDSRWRHRHWVFAVAVGCCLTAGQPESSFIALALSGFYAVVTMAVGGAGRWRLARRPPLRRAPAGSRSPGCADSLSTRSARRYRARRAPAQTPQTRRAAAPGSGAATRTCRRAAAAAGSCCPAGWGGAIGCKAARIAAASCDGGNEERTTRSAED